MVAPIVFHRYSTLALLVLLPAVAACGSGDGPARGERSRIPLEQGGFVSFSQVADLRGSTEPPLDNTAVWVPQPVATGRGWASSPRGWRPTVKSAGLEFRSWAERGSTLEVGLLQRQETPVENHQVEILFNGRSVGGFHTGPGLTNNQVFLAPGLLSRLNEVEIRFDSALGGPPRQRLDDLTLVSFGIQVKDRKQEPVRGWLTSELGGATALDLTRAGVLVLPWRVPERRETLTLEVEGLGREGSTLAFYALPEGRDRVDLQRFELEAGGKLRQSIAITGIAGERVTLCLQVVPRGRDGGARLAGLWVDPGPGVGGEAPVIDRQPPAAHRPDVLMIILDAARGDRFPGWDYPREVMPNLTALSRDSMVLRHAFSECPTTSCSIPALVTGLSFLPGGEVGKGKQLSGAVVTLAEYLQSLGYRTVGFSATPNNSASRNLDQGFDEFRELWGRGNPDHGPFNMSRLGIEAIRNQPAGEPLFLQLHYLPPHQPYAPGPEFDRFTDADYSGPIRADLSLGPINDGSISLTERDVEQLIGLYDGNLLLADAVVGQVLDALRETDRFENTLIVVTSDHGEAFMEHGMAGHNTTLFDEMLHVPLMIRLPGGEVPAGFDPSRLASTLDVVPTVLGYLGAATQTAFDGVDLVNTVADPRDPRMLFLRTSHPRNGMVAARTTSWKQISWPRLGSQWLFDLRSDPTEKSNLVAKHPDRYASMGLRIRRHLVEAASRRLGEAGEVELTEEAEESLKALGYLE